jgi:hypothetical protein
VDDNVIGIRRRVVEAVVRVDPKHRLDVVHDSGRVARASQRVAGVAVAFAHGEKSDRLPENEVPFHPALERSSLRGRLGVVPLVVLRNGERRDALKEDEEGLGGKTDPNQQDCL